MQNVDAALLSLEMCNNNLELFLEKNNDNLEFGMRMARHLILKEIKNGSEKNVLLSPLSLHAALNMVASGSTGRTLKQLLHFLESDNITHLNAQSSQIMDLTTTAQEFVEPEDGDDHPNSQPRRTTSCTPSLADGHGGFFQSMILQNSKHDPFVSELEIYSIQRVHAYVHEVNRIVSTA